MISRHMRSTLQNRASIIAFACSLAVSLAACTTPSGNGNADANGVAANAPISAQTPAQIAAQVCPPVQTAMTGLNALAGLPEGAQKDLATITPMVAAVCTVGATANIDNLQQLAQTALPAIVNVVKASALSVEEQDAIIVDVTAAQLVLTAVTQAQANITASGQH
jgi:hypothetical protein